MSVHNGLPYLKEAVESILKQTYKNFEFIIIDDASTDKSWEYLNSLKDKRIKLIRNKKNLGLAASLNVALRLARGDYIARMDADDVSLANRIEIQKKFLMSHPSIDICGTWADLINEDGQVIGEKKYPTKDIDIKNALARFSAIVHPTIMTKVKVYRQLKGYDPKFDLAEDYEFLLRAKDKFKMANISQKLLLWRLWEKRQEKKCKRWTR
jgi:glycosyltransferase involved in cell wall biosynthesis